MTRPLLILDCDGVLMHFLDPFTAWLRARHGLALRMESFALSGNVRRADGTPVPDAMFRPLLDGFFDEAQESQTLLPGVADALGRLGERAELVILTNIEPKHRLVRERVLARDGLHVRVVPNGEGVPKGRAVAELAAGRTAVFVDDLPPHHTSVKRHAEHVGRVHLVGEEGVRGVMPDAPDAHARFDDWAAAEGWIADWLKKEYA